MGLKTPSDNHRPSLAMNHSIFSFNTTPRIESIRLKNGLYVLVVDDVLNHPEKVVALAQEVQAEFVRAPDNPFPGCQLVMPPDFSLRLDDYFRVHARGLLGGRRSVNMYARLSKVTLPPETLDARQRICHRDNAGVDPGHSIFASVLYLFKDPALGGTVFFRPSVSPNETEILVHDASSMNTQGFASKYKWDASYMTESNRYFEVIGRVAAKWNRIIFYDGGIFHSSDISAPEKLNALETDGRLTVNGFFTCTRRAS
jgi:hypothetical protein